MKKQARLANNNPLNPADKFIDTVERVNNTLGQPDIQPTIHKDAIKKLTFQIRESVFERLKDAHYYLGKDLGKAAPDREVIIEEAIARLLDQLEGDTREAVAEALATRQKTREEELENGLLRRATGKTKS